MAKKEKQVKVPTPKKEKEPSYISWLQLALGVGALALAANLYFNYYPLPGEVLIVFLVLIGLYQIFRALERRAHAYRKERYKRYI